MRRAAQVLGEEEVSEGDVVTCAARLALTRASHHFPGAPHSPAWANVLGYVASTNRVGYCGSTAHSVLLHVHGPFRQASCWTGWGRKVCVASKPV